MEDLGFHSISFPSEWGAVSSRGNSLVQLSFHSISFPSEWGEHAELLATDARYVSIQLVSPASGEFAGTTDKDVLVGVSIQLVSPASGEYYQGAVEGKDLFVCFHSISFPSEWGEVG